MRRGTIAVVALAVTSVWVILAAGATAVWLTEEVRVFGLVMLPAGIVASLLVLYFDWRARLLLDIRGDRNPQCGSTGAADHEAELPPEPPIAA